MWCTPTKRNKLHTLALRYAQLKLTLGWQMTHLSIWDLCFCTYLNVFYHLYVISDWFFKHFPTKNSECSALCHIQNYRNRKLLKANFSKWNFQRNRSWAYTQMVISQKVGVWTGFWYQIETENVLLTMIPKTHFTQKSLVPCFVGVPHIHICTGKQCHSG